MKKNLTLLSLVGLIILNMGATFLNAQVVFDANSVCASSTTTNITMLQTGNLTVPVNNKALLVVLIKGSQTETATSVTFNAQPLARFGSVVSHVNARAEIWYTTLGNVASPITSNVAVTWLGAHTYGAISAASFHNVDQTTPLSNLTSNNFITTDVSTSVTVSGSSGDMVVEALSSIGTTTTAPTFTPTTSQTECVSCASTPFNEFRQSAAYKTQTGSTTLSWNLANLSMQTDNGIQIAVNIKSAGNILPVELVNFSGTPRSGEVRLDWQTANEINSKGFYIERLKGADTWITFGFVPSQSKGSDYQFIDEHPLYMNYYRLRQIDNDGKETRSKIISIESKGKATVKIYPSVTTGEVTLEGAQSFEIVNIVGQVVQTFQGFQTLGRLNLTSLASGIYLVRGLDTEGSSFVQKIVKQ